MNAASSAPLLPLATSDMTQAYKDYLIELTYWRDNEDVEAYASHFFSHRLMKTFEMNISFDDRIVEPLYEAIKFHDFIEYTSQPGHRSAKKDKLRKIIEILGESEFISFDDWQKLTFKMENYSLKNSIGKFLEAADKVQQ